MTPLFDWIDPNLAFIAVGAGVVVAFWLIVIDLKAAERAWEARRWLGAAAVFLLATSLIPVHLGSIASRPWRIGLVTLATCGWIALTLVKSKCEVARVSWESLAKNARGGFPVGGAIGLALTPALVAWMGRAFPIKVDSSTLDEWGISLPDQIVNGLDPVVIEPEVPEALLVLYLAGLAYVAGRLVFSLACPPSNRILEAEFSTSATPDALDRSLRHCIGERTDVRRTMHPEVNLKLNRTPRWASTLDLDSHAYKVLAELDPTLLDQLHETGWVARRTEVILESFGRANLMGGILNRLETLRDVGVEFAELKKVLRAIDPNSPIDAHLTSKIRALCDEVMQKRDLGLEKAQTWAAQSEYGSLARAITAVRSVASQDAPVARVFVWGFIATANVLLLMLGLQGMWIVVAAG